MVQIINEKIVTNNHVAEYENPTIRPFIQCFHRELKQFKFNYMFCICFVICYCRPVNINNYTFIAAE